MLIMKLDNGPQVYNTIFCTCVCLKASTIKKKVEVAQLCLQARILEWVAFPFSKGSSQPRDRTQVSCLQGGFFTSWAAREAQELWSG